MKKKEYKVVFVVFISSLTLKRRMDKDLDEYLSSVYYDASGSGGLGGIDRLYRKVKA